MQQMPPLQQSAVEVATADPANAIAATIINRYFILNSPLELILTLACRNAGKPTQLNERESRRRHGRTLGAQMLVALEGGKRFL